jgi:hypothetical protein
MPAPQVKRRSLVPVCVLALLGAFLVLSVAYYKVHSATPGLQRLTASLIDAGKILGVLALGAGVLGLLVGGIAALCKGTFSRWWCGSFALSLMLVAAATGPGLVLKIHTDRFARMVSPVGAKEKTGAGLEASTSSSPGKVTAGKMGDVAGSPSRASRGKTPTKQANDLPPGMSAYEAPKDLRTIFAPERPKELAPSGADSSIPGGGESTSQDVKVLKEIDDSFTNELERKNTQYMHALSQTGMGRILDWDRIAKDRGFKESRAILARAKELMTRTAPISGRTLRGCRSVSERQRQMKRPGTW